MRDYGILSMVASPAGSMILSANVCVLTSCAASLLRISYMHIGIVAILPKRSVSCMSGEPMASWGAKVRTRGWPVVKIGGLTTEPHSRPAKSRYILSMYTASVCLREAEAALAETPTTMDFAQRHVARYGGNVSKAAYELVAPIMKGPMGVCICPQVRKTTYLLRTWHGLGNSHQPG